MRSRCEKLHIKSLSADVVFTCRTPCRIGYRLNWSYLAGGARQWMGEDFMLHSPPVFGLRSSPKNQRQLATNAVASQYPKEVRLKAEKSE